MESWEKARRGGAGRGGIIASPALPANVGQERRIFSGNLAASQHAEWIEPKAIPIALSDHNRSR
jgi:hypothetical protein